MQCILLSFFTTLGLTLRIDEIHSDLINRLDSTNARIDRFFGPAVTKYEHGKMDPQAPGIIGITKPRPPPKYRRTSPQFQPVSCPYNIMRSNLD